MAVIALNHNRVLAGVAVVVFIWLMYTLSIAVSPLAPPDVAKPAPARPQKATPSTAAAVQPPPPPPPPPKAPETQETKETPETPEPSSNSTSSDNTPRPAIPLLEGKEAEEFCKRYRFDPFDATLLPQRKIYDLLLVNTELEMLEVRLGEMYDSVDYFIILEADRTFTDKPKPLHLEENWDLFAPWHDKMIRRTVDFSALDAKSGAWDRERTSRNAMLDQVLPFLEGEQKANIDDVLLVSDVDEIPKRDVLRALRNCAVPQRVTINSDFYYYSFQWLSREEWGHPQATLYKGEGEGETARPDELRHNAKDYYFKHGAWHCSYCFSSMKETVGKVNSFSHQELNKPEFKDPAKILQRVRFGTDFFDRAKQIYDYLADNRDVPAYVRDNADRFGFMLDRNPPNANFKDVPADGDVSGAKFE